MHALGFRVMRLCKPSLQSENPFRLDLATDLTAAWEPGRAQQPPLDASTAPFADRTQLHSPEGAWGLEGLLELPQSFGVIYLGEVLGLCLSICSWSGVLKVKRFLCATS